MMTREQHMLLKLAEEAAEIAQIALKAMQFGMDEGYSGETDDRRADGLSNKQRIHLELNDLNGVIKALNTRYAFNYSPGGDAMLAKVAKIDRYRGYSETLGLVQKS